MRTLAALFVFALLSVASSSARADVGPEPEPDLPAETGGDTGKPESSKGCAIDGQPAVLGLAALALLLSGAALRRRAA